MPNLNVHIVDVGSAKVVNYSTHIVEIFCKHLNPMRAHTHTHTYTYTVAKYCQQ
jgi:hypothetical protein